MSRKQLEYLLTKYVRLKYPLFTKNENPLTTSKTLSPSGTSKVTTPIPLYKVSVPTTKPKNLYPHQGLTGLIIFLKDRKKNKQSKVK